MYWKTIGIISWALSRWKSLDQNNSVSFDKMSVAATDLAGLVRRSASDSLSR